MNYGLEASTLEELRALAGVKCFKKHVIDPRYKKPRSPKKVRNITEKTKVNCYGKLTTIAARKSKIISENPNIGKTSESFVIPGRAVGYYSLGAKPNFKRMKQYHTYKNYVCEIAKASGIKLPLKATRDYPIYLHCKCYFENGTHSDPENVLKGIRDSLFYDKEFKGLGDKYTGGKVDPPLYDKENPRVEICIEYNYVQV